MIFLTFYSKLVQLTGLSYFYRVIYVILSIKNYLMLKKYDVEHKRKTLQVSSENLN